MRKFTVSTPVVSDREIDLDDVTCVLTDEDAKDLNAGFSVTTLTTQGEEVAVSPEELL